MRVTDSCTACLIRLAALHKISFDEAYFLLYFLWQNALFTYLSLSFLSDRFSIDFH